MRWPERRATARIDGHSARIEDYHFHVYALDTASLGPPGLSKQDALEAMDGHILDEGELTGTYKRASA